MGQTAADMFDYDQIWTSVYGDIQRLGPVHRHMRRLLTKLLNRIEFRSVLEIGCGPGTNVELLCRGRQIERFTGADISPWALEQARQRFGSLGQFVELDIERSHLDDVWDLVFCSLVMEHLPQDQAALEHMRAMAGRYLLISTMAGNFERYRAWDEKMGHVRNYQVGELEEKLRKAGFRVRESIYWGFPFYTPLVRTLQNHASTDTAHFGLGTRLLAQGLYWLYWLNSSRRGDLLIVLAEV
ncbi:MAG TPA: methyltransferase domain-containing protein [Phycisphaeraceae bacterium]